MCVVSNIGNQWQRGSGQQWSNVLDTGPTRFEFDALKAEMVALRSLLEAGKNFDTVTKQPDCEDEDKVALIKRLAKAVGVDMSSVFK